MIAIGTLVIALSIVLVLIAEGGRRWAERRLVGETELEEPDPLAQGLVAAAPVGKE